METGLPDVVTAFLEPFTDPVSRTWWGALLAMVGITAIWLRIQAEPFLGWARLGKIFRSPSSMLDVQMLLGRQLLRLLIAGPTVATGWLIATHLVRRLDAWIGVPATPGLDQSMVVALPAFRYSWPGI